LAIALSQPDADLIPLLAIGDERAVDSLYDRYSGIAFGLAFRMLNDRMAAEDVVQDAFVALWRHGRSFDPDRGQVKSWLLRIVRNRAIDRLRGGATHRETTNIDDIDLPVADTAWDHVSAGADRKQIRSLLGDLPSNQRRAIELTYFGGLSQPEVAATMRVPLGTVKSRQRLGLEKMRQALQSSEVN
jgi:RNA polymerase sigma-70 factor (ECF subfamily)